MPLYRTDLTGSNLAHTNLTNTIYQYQQAVQERSSSHNVFSEWHKKQLAKDLMKIEKWYLSLKDNQHKAQLLHVVSGYSNLPFYKGKHFLIEYAYWSCQLFQLQKALP